MADSVVSCTLPIFSCAVLVFCYNYRNGLHLLQFVFNSLYSLPSCDEGKRSGCCHKHRQPANWRKKKNLEILAKGKLPNQRKKEGEGDDEDSEAEPEDDELDEADDGVVASADAESASQKITPILSEGVLSEGDSDDEEYQLTKEVADGINIDAEAGLIDVRKLNVNGDATEQELYTKFTDVFETRFFGCCGKIPLMRYFLVSYVCKIIVTTLFHMFISIIHLLFQHETIHQNLDSYIKWMLILVFFCKKTLKLDPSKEKWAAEVPVGFSYNYCIETLTQLKSGKVIALMYILIRRVRISFKRRW